jgi:hypothetical protein
VAVVVVGGGVVHAPVVPDGQVVLAVPAVAELQVVVLRDELDEPVEEVVALGLAETVNLLGVVADCVDGLPAGDLQEWESR